MNLQELYDRLEMSSPEDFQYFEQLAELIEMPEHIEFDDFYTVLSEVPSEIMGEIIEYYMKEMTEALPRNGENLLTTFESVKQRLLLLCENLEDMRTRRTFVEELFRFKEWFTQSDTVSVNNEPCSLFEALMSSREEALTGAKVKYDLSGALGYEIEELEMPLGSFSKINVAGGEEPEEDDCCEDPDCDCHHHHHDH